ncbi:MAG TPA: hypothetical protein VMY77_16380 [Chitinophagaceae bacterium]|nr:hypothetical protein [Chitinophagaceae bacterium]
MKLNIWVKILLVCIFLALSIVGFLIKLPQGFRHIDKELHAVFYFFAAALLNILFANRKIIRHVLIFVFLYLFGVAIEYSQEYSNKFFHKRIHGRYDIEDVHSNLKGLVAFSILWIIYIAIQFVYNKSNLKKVEKFPE